MKELEKLRVLLPHWIDHNKGHEADCSQWAELARSEGQEEIAGFIEAAVEAMKQADELLEKALNAAGGPTDSHHHHHHHHHD